MFIPKWLLKNILRQLEDNEIRIKRLELIQLRQAQNRIESAKKEIADLNTRETSNFKKYSTIEEIIQKSRGGEPNCSQKKEDIPH